MQQQPRNTAGWLWQWVNDLTPILYTHRDWHRREQYKYGLHPTVQRLIRDNVWPENWQLVVLQWPHISVGDPARVAYTQDDRKGVSDIQTVTSLGKYLRRHWPQLADHEIRDIVAFAECRGVEIISTTEEMVEAVQNGPYSCMQWYSSKLRCDGEGHHPYEVYDPELGWKMAIRRNEDGEIVGRALLLEHDYGKCFVRTYQYISNGQSEADEQLYSWLIDAGYKKLDSWPEGTEMRRINIGNSAGFLVPYIDGNTKTVELRSRTFVIDEDGPYKCDNTDGTPDMVGIECSDCLDDVPRSMEDEGCYIGYHGDCFVCHNCVDNYTLALGRGCSEYYVHDDSVVHAEDGTALHDDYMNSNGYFRVEGGSVYPEGDTFVCDYDNCRYHIDDGVECSESGAMVHKTNCWECAQSGNTYSDSVSYEEVDGVKVHPDHLDAYMEEHHAEAA